MRPLLLPGLLAIVSPVAAALALGACDQDSYASNPTERETHMGEIHAGAPSSAAVSAAVAPSRPTPATSMTGALAPPSASH